jgi:hypothetical protein
MNETVSQRLAAMKVDLVDLERRFGNARAAADAAQAEVALLDQQCEELRRLIRHTEGAA